MYQFQLVLHVSCYLIITIICLILGLFCILHFFAFLITATTSQITSLAPSLWTRILSKSENDPLSPTKSPKPTKTTYFYKVTRAGGKSQASANNLFPQLSGCLVKTLTYFDFGKMKKIPDWKKSKKVKERLMGRKSSVSKIEY